MKKISAKIIKEKVHDLCIDANINIDPQVNSALKQAIKQETAATAKEILSIIVKNHELARQKEMPLCQDTGMALFFVDIGQDIHVVDGNINHAINEGVKSGYKSGYLRKSVVYDPAFQRKNTESNTPALIHYNIVPGDQLTITCAPKGGGAENMSRIQMMKPADGIPGIKNFVLESVKQAGGNPCPPLILGIGVGSNFEGAALLAKKALLRPLNSYHPEQEWADLEKQLLKEINELGIGPMGLGGKTTAIGVNILTAATHIASLPVAINFQCHCHRHKTIIIEGS